ncbi:MAG: NAD-dependent epimerase/dehydratase family protein [Leptolyngbya sp. SIO1E4]|nr:NAD-dependent epimerase/dehydratase family protein [Leptolyngbya sp. SIO1E4]
MNILVIGGTNFIGPHVVRQLVEQGHQVTVFHRGKTQADLPPTVPHIYGDRAQLSDYQDTFYKLAPEVVLDMVAHTEAEAQALVDLFRGHARRVVVISSQDVYRARDIILGVETGILEPTPLTEESPLRSQLYPYKDLPEVRGSLPADYDKILVEQTCQRDPELPATVLRLPMVYGPGDYRHRFQAYLRRMDERRPAIVLETGIANWCGCYGYVENVADAIALAVTDERAAGRTYNIANPDSLSEADLIRAIGQQAGWEGRVVSIPAAQMPASWQMQLNAEQHWTTDSTRIRQELGFVEKVPREEALRRTIAWERTAPESNIVHNPTLLDYAAEDALLATLTKR